MIVTRVTAGSVPVSLADAKEYLRVDHDEDDAVIAALTSAACNSVAENVGRVLTAEQWIVSIDSVYGDFEFPLAPVQSVDAIEYFDADDQAQTADVSDFYLFKDEDKATLRAKAGKSWPATARRDDAISITFTVGMQSVPDGLISAAKMLLGHWYETRSAVSSGQTSQEVPLGVQYLCDQARRTWVVA